MKESKQTKICPMRFSLCINNKCAWYCTYPNGEGECAIHSLPGLFDGLNEITGAINNK